jgi:hypothetical protein
MLKPHVLRALFGAFAAAVLVPQTAFAAWPNNPTVNVPLCTVVGDQTGPMSVTDGAGGAVVVWTDGRTYPSRTYAQHVSADGTADPAWPANGRVVCSATGSEMYPAIVSDGAGGVIVTWMDSRGGADWDIYAQHLLADGTVDPAWPADGRAVCVAAGSQQYPVIASDGTGGAIVAWQDQRSGNADVYAQRVMAGGAVDPAWPANGRALCTAGGGTQPAAIVSDGAGGAIVTWEDARIGWGNTNVYAQHVQASGAVDPAWPANGRALCTATANQSGPVVVTDGSGGAIVAWRDARSGTRIDLYAQRVRADGTVDPAWPTDGRAVCTAAYSRSGQAMAADGSGGALLAWSDYRNGTDTDIYAQHVVASGGVDPAWPDGRALCVAPNDQVALAIASDGAGGAIASWQDARDGTYAHIYAQHALASGAADPAWPADGRAVCTAAGNQMGAVCVADGAGGVVIAWADGRNFADGDIYAQAVTGNGRLGTAKAPEIIGVRDVPNDQGGKVRITWSRSLVDTLPTLGISLYGVWRQAPPAAANRALSNGAVLVRDGDPSSPVRPGVFRASTLGTQTTFWEGVGTVAARGDPTYSFVALTLADSTAAAPARSVFMIDAHLAFVPGFFDSSPDSGCSVDNLAPVAPALFTGQYAAGAATLHWGPNSEPDLAGYRLYRGDSPSFVPGPGNLVAAVTDTGLVVVAGAPAYYKLSAVDFHGNESPYAFLLPSATAGVEDGPLPRGVSFAPPSPNPAREGATLAFALPRGAHVELAIFDPAGRRVRALVSGARAAGEQAARWDLSDDAGRAVSAGLYFARLEVEGQRLVRRLAVTR